VSKCQNINTALENWNTTPPDQPYRKKAHQSHKSQTTFFFYQISWKWRKTSVYTYFGSFFI